MFVCPDTSGHGMGPCSLFLFVSVTCNTPLFCITHPPPFRLVTMHAHLFVHAGHVFNSFTGHESWVRCAVLSPDEKNLATCAQDHTVRIWDVDKGIQLHVINTHSKAVTSVAWVHSAWVVSTGRDGLLSAYNMQVSQNVWEGGCSFVDGGAS